MLTSIKIENFRCFRELEVKPLKRVNLIAGKNNAGKTCLLEALAVMLDQQGNLTSNLSNLLRAGSAEFWNWIFFKKNNQQIAEFYVGNDGKNIRGAILPQNLRKVGFWANLSGTLQRNVGGLQFVIENSGRHLPVTAVFSTKPSDPKADAISYNRVTLKRRKKQVESLMKQFEPRLEAIEPLHVNQQAPAIYVDIGLPEMIPVTQLGQGFGRLLTIYSEVMAEEAQVVLIDEIENGIHHSVLPDVWRGLAQGAAQAGIQVFATTHSWECIVAAHKTFAETLDYDFALHRLERVGDDIKSVTYDREALEGAIKGELEVR